MDGLTVKKISKTYDGKKYALRDVTLSFPEKGILAIIGRNGAGKTTLIRILSTELMPTKGSAMINGIDVIADPVKARDLMAIVPQEARAIPWMNPRQQVLSYLLYRGFPYREASSRASAALKSLGLEENAKKLSRMLSGELKGRSWLQQCLPQRPKSYFLMSQLLGSIQSQEKSSGNS